MEKAFNVIGMVWVGILTAMVIVSLGFAVYQLCAGNYTGTASFEF